MRVYVSVLSILLSSASCFEENLGNTSDAADALDAGTNAGPGPGQCAPVPDAGVSPMGTASEAGGYSNGVTWLAALDPDEVTTIDGSCELDVDVGTIDCEGLALRLNVPGVFNGIGYERVVPTDKVCAGEAGAPAPGIGVFSFGSLVMAPGAKLYFRGERAVALVAVRTIELTGDLHVWGDAGGFVHSSTGDALATYGPASGASVRNVEDGKMGAPGAGANGIGGAGGNCGHATSATVPQFEPICGGSTGGSVGHDYSGGGNVQYAEGGAGGGAILIAAGESVSFSGTGPCGLHANAGGGAGSEFGGAGGGGGGTIVLEAPLVDLGDCWITANGGGGGAGGRVDGNEGGGAHGGDNDDPAGGGFGIDVGGAGGARNVAAESGALGDNGGGGGGAAGFIRVRTDQCGSLPATFSPQPTCERLEP